MSYNKAYYERNKDAINARGRKRFSNPEWRAKNMNKRRERIRRYTLLVRSKTIRNCLSCGGEFSLASGFRKYCGPKCSDHGHALKTKKHRSSSHVRDAINSRARERYKQISVRLRKVVNASVSSALKRAKGTKRGSILDALPYSIPQLKAHLESQFDNANGFSWENYGSAWQIDHIIPCVLFPYTTLDCKQFRDCWALSNLRPLASLENIKKHAKYFPDYQI